MLISMQVVSDQEVGRLIRCLLVDDNAFNQKVFGMIFRKQGIELQVVTREHELISRVHCTSFSAIFLNLHMPRLNGFEVAAALQELLVPRCPPIIGLTVNRGFTPEEHFQHDDLGEILTLPLTPGKLRDCLQRQVERQAG